METSTKNVEPYVGEGKLAQFHATAKGKAITKVCVHEWQ